MDDTLVWVYTECGWLQVNGVEALRHFEWDPATGERYAVFTCERACPLIPF